MKKTLALLLIALGSIQCVLAQDSASVRFYVKGSETYFIRLNGQLLPTTNIHRVAKGEHELEIFSPKHLLYTSSLAVTDTVAKSFYAELDKDPDYVAFLREKDAYTKKQFAMRALPAMVSVYGIATFPLFYSRTKNAHQEFVIDEFRSRFTLSENVAERSRIRYNRNNTMMITSAGAAVVGAATYFLLSKRIKKIKKPFYKQQNPFTLDYFEMSFNQQHNAPQFSVGLNF